MSACNAQAMSHVGCRLIVASSAKISRPLACGACGDIARAFATKAAMSSAADVFASGTALPDADCAAGSALFGLVGSPDMGTRKWLQAYVLPPDARVNAARAGEPCCERCQALVGDRLVHRDRPRRIRQIGDLGRHRLQIAVVAVLKKLVEHALNGRLDAVRTGVAHL